MVQSFWRTVWQFIKKFNIELPYDLEISLWAIEPRGLKTDVNAESCTWMLQFSSVQLLSRVWLFVTPWITARQGSLSITNSRSSPIPMSIESVMPSNHLILCRPLLLLPSIFPSIQGLFKWVSSLHQVAKVLEFQLQHQSFQWILRTDLL